MSFGDFLALWFLPSRSQAGFRRGAGRGEKSFRDELRACVTCSQQLGQARTEKLFSDGLKLDGKNGGSTRNAAP
jgi:hypothetical protein